MGYSPSGSTDTDEREPATLQKAVTEVQGSENPLRTIIDTIPALVWCFRPDGMVNYFNQRWHEYTGISREQAFGFGDTSSGADVAVAILHPDDAPGILATWMREILPGSKGGEFEVRMRRHDGEYRWFMVRFEPLLDDTGRVIQWYAINTDIEDLKRAEEKAAAEEAKDKEKVTDNGQPATADARNPAPSF